MIGQDWQPNFLRVTTSVSPQSQIFNTRPWTNLSFTVSGAMRIITSMIVHFAMRVHPLTQCPLKGKHLSPICHFMHLLLGNFLNPKISDPPFLMLADKFGISVQMYLSSYQQERHLTNSVILIRIMIQANLFQLTLAPSWPQCPHHLSMTLQLSIMLKATCQHPRIFNI